MKMKEYINEDMDFQDMLHYIDDLTCERYNRSKQNKVCSELMERQQWTNEDVSLTTGYQLLKTTYFPLVASS